MLEPWQLGLIDEYGYNGIREEHIERVADSLLETGLTSIDRETFKHHSRMNSMDTDNFNQEDLDKLQRKLNE